MVTCLSGPEDRYLTLFGLQIMLVFLSEAGHDYRDLWTYCGHNGPFGNDFGEVVFINGSCELKAVPGCQGSSRLLL